MASVAKLEDLVALNNVIKGMRKQHPDAYGDIKEIILRNRSTGYRNFCKLFIGEWTPEELKSGKKNQRKDMVDPDI